MWVIFCSLSVCVCGDFQNGSTSYAVDGYECCSSTPLSSASLVTYTEQYPGIYAVDEVDHISGQDAQERCCD